MNTANIRLEPVTMNDLPAWIDSKKVCYKDYVDQYYGGWNDETQTQLNTSSFKRAIHLSYFRKIVYDDQTVGFLGYDEQADRITGITIHMYPIAQNRGTGSRFLQHISALSRATGKPADLKVFKTNPAKCLYERFGFKVYDENTSHYFMKLIPIQAET